MVAPGGAEPSHIDIWGGGGGGRGGNSPPASPAPPPLSGEEEWPQQGQVFPLNSRRLTSLCLKIIRSVHGSLGIGDPTDD